MSLFSEGSPCPFHGLPIGPAPARNCQGCRDAIAKLLTDEAPDVTTVMLDERVILIVSDDD